MRRLPRRLSGLKNSPKATIGPCSSIAMKNHGRNVLKATEKINSWAQAEMKKVAITAITRFTPP